jgi:magnesium chelatase subunit D
VTDGRATFAPGRADPVAAAASAADAVRRAGVEAVVIDVEVPGAGRAPGLGLARDLAVRMGARHLPLATVTPEGLRQAVRDEATGS